MSIYSNTQSLNHPVKKLLRSYRLSPQDSQSPDCPRTDPSVRNYRTGFFRNTRFRKRQISIAFFAIPCREVCISYPLFSSGRLTLTSGRPSLESRLMRFFSIGFRYRKRHRCLALIFIYEAIVHFQLICFPVQAPACSRQVISWLPISMQHSVEVVRLDYPTRTFPL